jgi:hypothetical protein
MSDLQPIPGLGVHPSRRSAVCRLCHFCVIARQPDPLVLCAQARKGKGNGTYHHNDHND